MSKTLKPTYRSLANVPVFRVIEEQNVRDVTAGYRRGVITLREEVAEESGSSEAYPCYLPSHRALVHICVLEQDIIRVIVLPKGDATEKCKLVNSWSIAPGITDVDLEGRDRLDFSGFTCPEFLFDDISSDKSNKMVLITTLKCKLFVDLIGFKCQWFQPDFNVSGEWINSARDRLTHAYDFSYWDLEKPKHFLMRSDTEMFFGLGETSGPMDKNGSLVRLSCGDAMGYDAEFSDPLYKHIPFYITYSTATKMAFGLFYDNMSDCEFDFGKLRSNYHGTFRSFGMCDVIIIINTLFFPLIFCAVLVAQSGVLDYYFIAGPGIKSVSERFTWLTGRPIFPPRFSLGYSGSTMSYTDAPDAQQQMNRFVDDCNKYAIPCRSFHLSSGYTSIGTCRYVFNWFVILFIKIEVSIIYLFCV